MFYLPRDRADAQGRGWESLRASDFPWPLPGDAFWRILGGATDAARSTHGIYRRKLGFYASDPPTWLIAIEGDGTSASEDRVAYMVQAGADLFPLTGRSDVIHELNERLGGPRPEQVVDYVDFFSSFVGGDEGPFLVPRNDAERAELFAADTFAEDAARTRAALVLGSESAAAHLELPPCKLERLAGDGETASVEAHIVYGSAIFMGRFSVAVDGAIEMVDDEPLGALQTVTRHRFVEHDGSSWLLREWGSRQKERITARVFLDRVFCGESHEADYSRPGIRDLEVSGDVVFPGCRPLPWLHCRGVDFRGSVVMDDCTASDRVLFEDCRVLGAFSARRAQFAKSLGLRRCQFLALTTERGQAASLERDRWGMASFGMPVALCLDSARIESDLDLERSTCHATLRARRMSVGADANLAGVRVLPLVVELAQPDKEFTYAVSSTAVALDLSDGEFRGAVNLGCAFDHTASSQMSSLPRHCHRPVVVGSVLLEGVRIEASLWLRGLGVLRPGKVRGADDHTAYFSLRLARIGGSLQNYGPPSLVWPPPTRVLGHADLTCATFGNYAELATFCITGDLDMGALEAQALFLNARWERDARPDDEFGGAEAWFDYSNGHPEARADHWRYCYVGGRIALNNARISGGLFGSGLQALGGLHALDGAQFGSIKVYPLVWLESVDDAEKEGSKQQVMRRHRPRFGALEFETAKITGTLEVFDTDIGRHLLLNNTTVAGGINLYGSDEMLAPCVTMFRDMGYTNDEAQLRSYIAPQLVTPALSTRVGFDPRHEPGSLSITGCEIGGSVELRNVRAAAHILLDDSRIAGDLATAPALVVGGAEQKMAEVFENGQRAITPVLNLEGCKAAVLMVHGQCIDQLAGQQPDENMGEMTLRTECRRFVFDGLNCGGDVRLWRVAASRAISGRHAEVAGKLSLHVVGAGMDSAWLRGSGEDGKEVMLERACFQQLSLVEPFPRNVKMRGIQVTHWDPSPGLQEEAAAAGGVDWERKAELMQKLLDRMPLPEPSVYLDVERHFRSLGHDDQADGFYSAMRERQAHGQEQAEDVTPVLWAWLAVLALPLGWLLLQLARGEAEQFTTAGLVLGLLAPWLLAYLAPPRPSVVGEQSWLPRLKLSASQVGGGALIVAIVLVFVSETLRAVLAVAALTFWVHLIVLLPFAVASRRLRSLVLGRLMMKLGTGYGTASHRLVVAWAFMILLPMAVVLHEPRNVEPTLFARGALKATADYQPNADQWRWDMMEPPPIWAWMAIEATVPIISLGAEDKWETADNPPAILACVPVSGQACRDIVVPFGTSPIQIEAFLRLIGWIFWPLTVTGVAAAFVHRRKQGA